MKQIKEFLRAKLTKICVMASCAMSLFAVPARAAIDTTAITESFSTGFTDMVTNSISMISSMVPIGLTLAGTLFLVKKGLGWFKSIAK